MERFNAFRIFEDGGKAQGRIVEMTVDELGAGEVVIRTAYSSVNYKDALAGTGTGKVVRRFPCVGGIDVAGTVVSSSDARFKTGDEVICTSYDMGVAHDGGYAGYARLPADWLVPLPAGLTLFDAMALGTAGYTAALGVELLEHNGMKPANGKVLVNGATGGVASLVIDMLAALGYSVTALTGKDSEHDYLKQLGAQEILSRHQLEMGTRPLEKTLWAAAFDSVGGEQLAWLTRTMQQGGVIASFGNAGGIEFKTTVLPFILRGVRLIGVDSAYTPMALRRKVWERLAGDLKPRHLSDIAQTVKLEQLPQVFSDMLKAQTKGRIVVDPH
ncbi:MAG TPA: oxidoreductase [Burkholderiales bacterium]|nr:oxidoreductase [Burkholderiales bacterium]